MITKKETESEGYIIMNRNSDILILLLLLALLAELRQTEAGAYAQAWPDPNISPAFSQTSAPTSFYGRPGRLRMPEPARLIGDFHRMTEVMGKVDHLGHFRSECLPNLHGLHGIRRRRKRPALLDD